MSALNASPESFVHKALKDEQKKNRMPWERRFGRATDGIRPERYISVNFKSVVSYGLCSQQSGTKFQQSGAIPSPVLLLKFTHYERNRRTCFRK